MQIELSEFYARLGSIALIVALGFILGRLKLISNKTNKQLVILLLAVFMPASLFSAFPSEYDETSAHLFFSGLAAGIIVMTLLIIVSRILFAKWWYKGKIRFESQFAFIFNNATFLGYPIVVNTFGPDGVIAYCGFIISFNVALFSYGVFLFEHQLTFKSLWRVVRDPNIIAVAVGMVMYLAELRLPSFANDAVGFVGGATTPLSVICIGYMLSHADFRKILKRWRLVVTALLQLILGPVITYFSLVFMQFPTEVVVVCTLIQALPTATSLALFATKYGGNEVESSELVALSTILSVATMPLMVWILLG